MTTSRYGLNLITESQSARIPANDFLLFLEAVKSGAVKSRSTTAQPGSPTDGDLYILPASPTGAAWTGQGNKYAWRYNGAWRFYPFASGDTVFVTDESRVVSYNGPGATWVPLLTENGWLANTYPAIFSLVYTASTNLAVGVASWGLASIQMALVEQGIAIPAGKTFVGTEASLNALTGATVGTYSVSMFAVDNANTQTALITLTGAANTWLRGYSKNLATGIFTLVGPSTIRIGFKNNATSPGALATNQHSVMLNGVFLP